MKEKENMLMVYGRLASGGRFKAYDFNGNRFPIDRKHATRFLPSERETLEQTVKWLNEDNPKYLFEIRKV